LYQKATPDSGKPSEDGGVKQDTTALECQKAKKSRLDFLLFALLGRLYQVTVSRLLSTASSIHVSSPGLVAPVETTAQQQLRSTSRRAGRDIETQRRSRRAARDFANRSIGKMSR
jgi:hypothetical protein